MQIIKNSVEPVKVPVKSDGSLYRYEVINFGATQRGYFDEPDEIAAWLIPGLAQADDTATQMKRLLEHAFFVQTHLQAHIAAGSPELYAALTEEEKNILDAPRNPDFSISKWEADLPIILVDVCYKPYSTALPPAFNETIKNNILWLKPASGINEYLITLDEIGFITLSYAAEAGA